MKHHHMKSSRRARPFTVVRIGSVFAAGALVLAACGGGGSNAAGANGMAGMDMNAAGADNAANGSNPVATTSVSIKNFAFSPATITVRVGSTVVWTNTDAVSHDV